MNKPFPVGGFVLVGGQSQRMGQDKAFLELQGKPLFLRTVELLRPYVAQVTLLGPAARFEPFGIPVVPDRRPGGGPLGALCTGLESSPFEWNAFLACDLPLLRGEFLAWLLQRALVGTADAIVPRTVDGWQPLCAAFHRRCRPVMEAALGKGSAGIVDVLPVLRIDAVGKNELATVGFSDGMFKNVNTAEDWERVQRELESQGP